MKLQTRLITSYITLIAVAFVVFYLISLPLIKNYVKNNVTNGLLQETALVKSMIIDALEDVEDRESYIKAIIAERRTLGQLGLSSSTAIFYHIRSDQILTPANPELNLSTETHNLLINKINARNFEPFNVEINDTVYMATFFPVPAHSAANRRIIIILYTPLSSISDFSRGFTKIMIIVFLAIMAAAVVVALVLAERITNPMVKLKKQAIDLKSRNFESRTNIKTGDEFEALSKSMNAAAEELANHNRVQREFLDNISHEFKTPLMSIQGYAEGIKDGIFPADRQTLDIITEESVRLKKLVGEISYLSKLESMPDFYNYTDIEISEVIERSVDSVSGLKNARSIKILSLNISKYTLRGDGEKLLQLMINILSNCLRYAKKAIFIDTSIRNDYYVITVKDDGDGFNSGEEDKIFRRFYKGPGGNSGLGLSIAIAIAQNHGGTITAGNAAPHGAVFEIILPIQSDLNI